MLLFAHKLGGEMHRPLGAVLALVCFGLASCSEPQSGHAELIHTGDWSALTPADITAVRTAGDDLEITLTDSGLAQIASDLPGASAAPVRIVVANRVAERDALLSAVLDDESLMAPGAGAYVNEVEAALSLANPDGADVMVELWRVHGSVRLQPADYANAVWRTDGVTLHPSPETAEAVSRLNAAELHGRWMLSVDDRHLASAPFTLTVTEDQIDAMVCNESYREAWRAAAERN
jgi:hypothetical protein